MQHFKEVLQGDEFPLLDVNELSTLLKGKYLNVQKEEEIFSAVIQWVKHDIEDRTRHLETLFECIRFDYFEDNVSKSFANETYFGYLDF